MGPKLRLDDVCVSAIRCQLLHSAVDFARALNLPRVVSDPLTVGR